ncbi:MAG: LLM class flavin-dependent oxidoreductase [Chloroflexi bacterium]|nr:LLM class flavin-dependent oxidoreductase [Chloroflexota bacterium]MCL5074293.1 LLM class flavin-dependent oxidoreductase [Chloroflexota bacterium]
MRAGVLILGRHPAERLVKMVKLSEACGYDFFWYADQRFFREVYASLALCAVHSMRIVLGPCVTDPYSRHPAMTAAAIATVDEISGGRAVLGIGAGYSGFAEMGLQREKPALAIREAIALIRLLLAGGKVDFQGKATSFSGKLDFPTRPDIPIYIASNSPKTLELAGEVADGVIISSCVSERVIKPAQELVANGARRRGRDPREIEFVARIDTCVCPDSRLAKAAVKPRIARQLMSDYPHFNFMAPLGLEVPLALRQKIAEIGYSHDPALVSAVADLVPDEFVDHLSLAGNAVEVAEKVNEMLCLGVDQITIYPMPAVEDDLEETIRSFAEEVRPRVHILQASAIL